MITLRTATLIVEISSKHEDIIARQKIEIATLSAETKYENT